MHAYFPGKPFAQASWLKRQAQRLMTWHAHLQNWCLISNALAAFQVFKHLKDTRRAIQVLSFSFLLCSSSPHPHLSFRSLSLSIESKYLHFRSLPGRKHNLGEWDTLFFESALWQNPQCFVCRDLFEMLLLENIIFANLHVSKHKRKMLLIHTWCKCEKNITQWNKESYNRESYALAFLFDLC